MTGFRVVIRRRFAEPQEVGLFTTRKAAAVWLKEMGYPAAGEKPLGGDITGVQIVEVRTAATEPRQSTDS